MHLPHLSTPLGAVLLAALLCLCAAVVLVAGDLSQDVIVSGKDDMSLWIDEQQVKQFFNGSVPPSPHLWRATVY